jgi:hypothetical protein
MFLLLGLLNRLDEEEAFSPGDYSPGYFKTKEEHDDFKSRARPAYYHDETGEIYMGRRGLPHSEVDTRGAPWFNLQRGFYDLKHKKFVPGSDVDFDSPDLTS